MFIPINSPSKFTKAPPELPGFIAASVCRKDSTAWGLFNKFKLLPFALIIPAVTVEFKLNGFPTASTHCPTFTLSELEKDICGKLLALILRSARSVVSSVPISSASYTWLLFITTSISLALLITWLFVTIYPSLEIITPEPLDDLSLGLL